MWSVRHLVEVRLESVGDQLTNEIVTAVADGCQHAPFHETGVALLLFDNLQHISKHVILNW